MSLPSPRVARRLRRILLDWYDANGRAFPWRATREPYPILVSEVMLQQTQASRIAERFPRFMARFPTVESLAAAPQAEVLAAWSGLGYNRRALALQRTAQAVTADGWPRDVEGLERLPGIGPYTARAIASLAFGVRVGVVDTNVRRWLVRRFGVTDTPRALQAVADVLATAGPDDRSGAWTHASMELGATICRARAPRCAECPLVSGCPSRHRPAPVPVARQPDLQGSDRAYRGAVVRLLSADARAGLALVVLRQRLEEDGERAGPAPDDAAWARVLAALERDGLVHRRDGFVRLGAATIGP